jgi:peptidoglycan/LPS O-acetylase OafA/YrhL
VLVQAYGRQRWAPFAWWGERRVEEGEERQEALQLFDVRRFLWRRAARLLPVYYLTNACGTLLAWLRTHGSGYVHL